MKLNAAIQDYLLTCEIKRYTPKTLKGYRNNLTLIARFYEEELQISEIEEVTLPTVKKFILVFVQKGYKGTYINGLLKSFKSFIQYCFEEGYGGFNTKNKCFPWVKEEQPIIPVFSNDDVKRLLKNCKGTSFTDIRDEAILTMFFETGLRCWELCCIKPEDIFEDYFIIRNGKNHKSRMAAITPVLKKALLKYERAKEKYFYKKPIDDYYFLSFHGKQLTNSAVEHVFKKRGEGITDVRLSPHTARHWHAAQSIRNGCDVYLLSKKLGHSNISITQTYLRSLQNSDIIELTKHESMLMNI